MKLIKFSTSYGTDVFVNTDQIVYVDGNDRESYLHLRGEMITVRGSLEEVVAKLMG